MPETFICENCGETHPLAERHEFEGHFYCPRCFSEVTVVCSHCDTRIWAGANAGNESTPLCESCYDQHYTTCEHCGTLIRNTEARYDDEDDGPYCRDCSCHHVILKPNQK